MILSLAKLFGLLILRFQHVVYLSELATVSISGMSTIFSTQSLSPERKLKMQEAREAIIDRLAQDINKEIDLDRFLRAIVSELGRMMDADRCDVIQIVAHGAHDELRISHEWRASNDVPSSLGTTLPIDLKTLSEQINLTRPIKLHDTSAPGLDSKVRLLSTSLGTRSLIVVPVMIGDDLLGLVGLHNTRAPRTWLDEEVAFLQSIAKQIAVGYLYTRLYTEKTRDGERTLALLEIANALNARSDFSEVTSLVLERAIALVGADYVALGVLDQSGSKINLVAFKAAAHVATDGVRGLIDAHGKSIDITAYPALTSLIAEGQTLKLFDRDLPFPLRLVFNATLGGRAALVAPVHIGGNTFGLLGLVWSNERADFQTHEVALVEGIADQIGTALERDQLSAEVMRLRSVLHERHIESRIIGQDPGIKRSIEMALNVADTQTSVLIQGESGTGKELLANLIHYNSQRKDKPYIKLNCGAIPESLLESELFGHERGAFTDARTRRRGRFEEADGGTLFLDEIGEMSMSAQVRLLRVLQDGEFTRIGGNEVLRSDVRVIAASNIDLQLAMAENRFRRDLYFRLSVFPINLAPLRERRMDIHPLVIHFIEHYKQKTGRFVSGIKKDALQALIDYPWPGNVRELENAIERAVIIASGRAIELDDLPETISISAPRTNSRAQNLLLLSDSASTDATLDAGAIKFQIAIPAGLDEIERCAIEATLRYTNGDKTRAAQSLGISRKTLYLKLQKYAQAEV